MGTAQIFATALAVAVTLVAVVLAGRAVMSMTAVIRQGRPDPGRFTDKGTRTKRMLVETAGHTRMLKWGVVGAAHWSWNYWNLLVGFGCMVASLGILSRWR